ncbi:MAG: ATP-binding protein [Mollicutes bacterium]|nr:MAG: ATP-binding protein [Mollicutes bacterium]
MNFDLDIIEHLGSKMYPTVPAAIAELIANSYDACSLIVQIKFFTKNGSNHSIEIIDEGTGMNFEEINKNFLMIGQNRRKKNKKNVFKNIERIVTGKKGLGKLALFGIGKKIDIETSNYEEQNQIKFSLI